MFGDKKPQVEDYGFGALRSATPAFAPRMEFGSGGHEPKVDLRKYCSPVQDQLTIGSCNACAIVGALEFQMLKGGRPLTPLSPLYVYYNGRKLAGMEKEDSGLLCHHATAAIMAYGACEEKRWPYRIEKFDREPPKECYDNSRTFETTQYARLSTPEEAKVALSQGMPIVFGFDIPRSYYTAAAKTGRMPREGTYDLESMSGHAMLIVGFDDHEGVWLARNSWGESFGEKGYCWIPYGLVNRYVWNDELWAIGSLEKVQTARLFGPTLQEAMRDVQQRGAQQAQDALKKLRGEIRDDLQQRTDDAKASMRDRLREQERQLEARRNQNK
ncbi:MAG: hypothetical protein EON61_11430 [Alphaproteobacteria bacterium]|jgi:C1A family cysteine protease|nr:MAG: hypothetical protein EON61_11430 [Alphaproteobacteria bacterium]